MPSGIATIGELSSGSGTLGLDCPACLHQHDYRDERMENGIGRSVYDCVSCGCISEDFIKAASSSPLGSVSDR